MLRPPPLESEEERRLRIAAELEAKRVSDRIDESLRLEREAKKRAPMNVKVGCGPCFTWLSPVLQQSQFLCNNQRYLVHDGLSIALCPYGSSLEGVSKRFYFTPTR